MALLKANTGIGTTNPTSALHVIGDGLFTGIVTATTFSGNINSGVGTITTFTSTNATITNITNTNLSSGVGTITTLRSTTGIITNLTGVAATITTLVSSASSLTNIYSSGISTLTNVGISSYLNVSGITTLGVTTATNVTAQNLKVSGITTLGVTNATDTTLQQLKVSGISTLGVTTATDVNAQNIIISGITTLGVTTATNITSQNLTISGISTFNTTKSVDLYVSGITTLGVTTVTDITGQNLTISGISTFNTTKSVDLYVSGITTLGVTTATNVTAQNLTISGISTFNTIKSVDLYVSGITTLGVTTATNATLQQLNVSGITTLGVTTISNVTAQNITVSGITTLGVTTATNATLQQLNVSGITTLGVTTITDVTAQNLKISGITTLGVTELTDLSAQHLNITGISTLSANSSDAAFRITQEGSGNALIVEDTTNPDNSPFIIDSDGKVGIGTTFTNKELYVIGSGEFTNGVTAPSFTGALIGLASSATQLQNPRTFEITGDIVASAISFDGTGNVSLAATIQPNSVGLGTDTTGDYVKNISGTSNQITVTSGTGEGSTPTLSIPNQFTIPQDATIIRDLQVNRNLNVNGSITIGGTSATLFTTELKITDPDLVLGFRTDGNGNDISNDTTANHGGIAVASTEGTPLVQLYNPGIGESTLPTYKKIMWFKSGSFAGLNTDAWLSNYAIGIGSTQVPNGVRLAVGGVQITDTGIKAVTGNYSGIVTANSFVSSGGYLKASDGTNALYMYSGTGDVSFQGKIIANQIRSNTNLNPTITLNDLDVTFGRNAIFSSGIVTASTFVGNLTGTATTSTNVIGGIGSLSQLQVTGVSTLGVTTATDITAQNLNISGITTLGFTTITSDAYIVGVVTASTFNGNINAGIVTVNSISAGGTTGTNQYVLTSTGTGLLWQAVTGTGAITGVNMASDNTNTTTYITFVSGAGTTAVEYISTDKLTFNPSSGNLGIGTSLPTSKLSVIGNANITGVVTASAFSGNATSSTNVIGGIGSLSQLQVTGVSTFTNGPVLIGSATSTGTANQRLQVTGGAYVSGNVAIGTNYANTQLEVNGIIGFSQNELGSINIRIGNTNTGYGITSGTSATNNIFIGPLAGGATNTGSQNTFVGYGAGAGNLGGAYNVYLGSGAGVYAEWNGSENVYIGYNAQTSGGGSQNVVIGSRRSVSSGSNQLAIGAGSTDWIVGNSSYYVGLGTDNPTSKLHVIGSGNFTGVVTASSFSGTATSTTNIPNLTGDITSVNTVTTLATVNSNVGSFGGLTTIPVVTVNAKGLVTGVSTVSAASTNSPRTIVARDSSGNFSAGIITATQFSTGASGTGINIDTSTITGPALMTLDPAAVGDNTGAVRIRGDLYVDGTQTYINSTTIELADFNVGIATTVGTNALLDGAGIGIGSTGIRKTITWNNSASALTSSEDWNLVSGKQYEINGTSVLNATTLGSGVVNSFLTSVGTLGQLTVTGVSTFTNGPVLIGSATSTGTASQRLQVTGGAYVSGTVGFGTSNPLAYLDLFAPGSEQLHVTSSSGGYFFAGYDGANTRARIGSYKASPGWTDLLINEGGGNVIIGTTSRTGTASQALQVNSGAYFNGSVGIGITNPSRTLSIVGTLGISEATGSGARTIISSTSSGFVLNHNDNSPIYFQTLGVNRFLWDHNSSALLIGTTSATGTASQPLQVTGGAYISGNLGIGTFNPATKLVAFGSQTTDIYSATVGPCAITNSTNNVDTTAVQTVLSLQRLGKSGTSYSSQVNFNVGRYSQAGTGGNTQLTLRLVNGNTNDPDTDVMTLLGSGNVGIGLTNPTTKLDVIGNIRAVNNNFKSAALNSASLSFSVGGNTSEQASPVAQINGIDRYGARSQYDGDLAFSTLSAGTVTEVGRFSYDGKLGIGATIPSAPLTILAPGASNVAVSNGFMLNLSGSDSGTDPTRFRIGFSHGNSTLSSNVRAAIGMVVSTGGGGNLVFETRDNTPAYAEKMRLDLNGNLGINATSPLQKLHTIGNFLLSADTTTAYHITQKPYTINNGTLSWEGSAGQLFSITNNLTTGSIFSVNDVSGIPSIDVNADGTVLIAPYNGNVGIGTLVPTNKLDVVGTTRLNGAITVPGDNSITFGPNSSYSRYLKVGGNGWTGNSTTASVATTDGNLHLDGADSTSGVYLNWYGGTGGTIFGNGSSASVGSINSSGNLSVNGAVTAGTGVYAAGTSGFYSTTYASNVRNPIWRFGNADTYGLSYFQGTAGASPAAGGDTIGFHFGTATAAASVLQVNAGSGIYVNGIISSSSTISGGQALFNYNSGVTGGTAPAYTQYNLQLYTSSNNVPCLSFHRAGYSATALYENDGQLYVNAWTTRAQTGLLLSSGNYNSYAPSLTGSGASGSWGISVTGSSASCTGNSATATNLSTTRTNWNSNGTITAVVGQLCWKNYGNNHTIFDASNSTSPDGTAVNNTNSTYAWTATYPTLMGWNGASTYGVRVDSARVADAATSSNSVSAAADAAIVNQDNGTSSAWRGRILSKNSSADKAVFLGTYSTIAGVFAHNNALNAWADLYVNTINGNDGGTTYINNARINSLGVGTAASGTAGVITANADSSFNGVTVGRGAASIASNTALGFQALNANTTATNGTAVGNKALASTTTGIINTAVGFQALSSNTTGSGNAALGQNALTANTTGINNTAVGTQSLSSNTTGYYITAVGYRALLFNTTGTNNTANGYQALYSNTIGSNGVANGDYSLYSNTTGNNNTAVGSGAGYAFSANANTTGSNNVFLGYYAINTAGGSTASNTIVLGNSSITTLRCNTATISALSDARDKKDIQEIPLGLAFLNELRPVRFTWNQRDGGRVDIQDSGFIAQEALEVVEKYDADWFGLVDHQNPEHFEMSNSKLIPVLVKAIQELSQQVQSLQEQITQKT